ncbi:MAG: NUDIX domain-containing protein [Alphaproteobacteria bacterium]|nr:NUDIX domain-containing protein [Alphaproteobacteria bacterium]MBU1516974.1 NUDIX domain-containing protein [Alphaproteobacteria bacterium]MBU2095862.1 NUDIX domain-containing protein [Alphaproteobacteria bacterium]MBU2152001.1 NUDIX domain-containing protein [Alphaproteobacteria bacterium]MBU2309522.1 NUDIX domain-containing protein [Alphaproteobacteria bacterium]
MTTPQFGQAAPGAAYPDRPAAFAVIERDGLIALVRVERQGRGLVLDLPGGGIDGAETAAEAAVRECGEEAGLVVALDIDPFVQADHFFLHNDGEIRNTRGSFFVGRVLAEDAALKIEDDHELVWTSPEEALLRLDRESHVWAIVTWLRLRARA